MLFNSINFVILLPIVFLLYWFAFHKSLKLQNYLILIANGVFYACWDWRFLFLLIFIILFDYFLGIRIHDAKNPKTKLVWLWFSISINIGILSTFKYFNFFIHSFADGLSLLGLHVDLVSLNIILPVGISFYTFIGLSYIIDIYKNKIIPEKRIVNFSIFLSFFPLILAGPIERAHNLLPQIDKKREFDYDSIVDGLKLVLWGMFKKVVIADRLAIYVNAVYNNSDYHSGITLILATLFFAIQIYCDFSGYADMAIGVAKVLGFSLMNNFQRPYLSKDITEFWRRWHISLSSWFRDYVFLPVAYLVSKHIKTDRILSIKTDYIIYFVGISLTWFLTGLWHGANYNFIIWGGIHGLLLILYRITLKTKKRLFKHLNISNNNLILVFIEVLITFIVVMFAWIFFRADNLTVAINIVSKILILKGSLYLESPSMMMYCCFGIIIILIAELKEEYYKGNFSFLNNKNWIVRNLSYSFLLLSILLIGVFDGGQFIYFQF